MFVPVTPPELARQLGHNDDGRAIRKFLRERYPSHGKWSRWELTEEQVQDVLGHFSDAGPSESAAARPSSR